jgi:hypothetical protein
MGAIAVVASPKRAEDARPKNAFDLEAFVDETVGSMSEEQLKSAAAVREEIVANARKKAGGAVRGNVR